jgi:hypothetical protein
MVIIIAGVLLKDVTTVPGRVHFLFVLGPGYICVYRDTFLCTGVHFCVPGGVHFVCSIMHGTVGTVVSAGLVVELLAS